MKYIYLDREEAKKGIALVVAVLEEKNVNFKEEFGESIIEFVGDDLPHYITYVEATDTVREATEQEKVARQQITLDDNQAIIDNVIYTYDKKYQKVVKGKIVDKTLKELVKEKTLTLDEVKNIKREELKNIRDEKVRENIKLYGAEFQIRNNTDIENFKDVERALDKGFKQLTDKKNWILADNSIRAFTYEQLSKILDEKALRKEKIYDKFGELSTKLQTCKTVEEIEAIKWE